MKDKEKKEQYEQYLRSQQWKIKRQEKAKLVEYVCEICGKIERENFEIHHKTYKNFTHEKMSDLMFLCKECHQIIHNIPRRERWEVQKHFNGEIKKEKRKRECKNCKYSTIMKYKGTHIKTVLYCNKLLVECDGICEHHYFGAEKEISKPKKSNKRTVSLSQSNKKKRRKKVVVKNK